MQPFDLVLMRNVLVYFEPDVRRTILSRIKDVLRPGGKLMLGGAEASPMARELFSAVNVNGVTYYQVN